MSEYKKLKIGIINLGINNIYSIYQATKSIGFKVNLIKPSQSSFNVDTLILPGTGSFSYAMDIIKKNNIDDKIFSFLSKNNKKFLGICLGMQLLFENSNEFGNTKGLGLIKGKVKKIKKTGNTNVPHIGWNKIHKTNKKGNLISKKNDNVLYYFIHSYYCNPKNKNDVSAFTKINMFKFASAIQKNNIFATQFHPEKSGIKGIEFLKKVLI